MSTITVGVTCRRCRTQLGSTMTTIGTHKTALQDAIASAGWPIYETHATECTAPLTGAAWIGHIINRVDTSYTIVP